MSRAPTLARPQTSPTPAPRPSAPVWPLFPAAFSGGLLFLCYFPLSWGFLAWFALVPLLCLVRSPSHPLVVYGSAFLGGVAFFLPALHWFTVAHKMMVVAWLFLTVFCTAYFLIGIWLVRLLDRRTALPLVLTFPAVWTALELLRSHFLTGFAWYLLAHTQHDFLPMIQVADLTGAYGVTFLVAAVNALLFEVLYARPWFRARLCPGRPPLSKRTLLRQGLVLFLVLMLVLAYGAWRLGEDSQTPGPTVALLKGTDPQPFRIARTDPSRVRGDDEPESMDRHFQRLCSTAAGYRPDLIVWPETSMAGDLYVAAPGVSEDDLSDVLRRKVIDGALFADVVLDLWHTPMLLGLNVREVGAGGVARRYNSAVLVDAPLGPQGHHGTPRTQRYDKMHPVPLGEYVPLREQFPWMNALSPYGKFDYSIWEGRRATRFALTCQGRPYTFGVLICSESADQAIGRAYGGGDGQPPADFLLEMSNDAWYDGTTQPQEHLAVTRFRAIESRRSVARAVNYGVPSVIDAKGRVLRPLPLPLPEHLGLFAGATLSPSLASLPWGALAVGRIRPRGWYVPPLEAGAAEWPAAEWGRHTQTPGVLLASIPVDHRVSLYALCGDWLPWACWAFVALGAVLAVFAPVRPASLVQGG